MMDRRRGIFGAPMVDPIDVSQSLVPLMPAGEQPAAPQKPSFFGQGGTGRNIAGYIGDALQQLGGGQASFAPMMARQQQQAYAAQQQQANRAAEFADFQQRETWKQQHAGPTDLEQRVGALDKLEPGLGGTYARNYAQNGGGMPTLMNVPGVGLVSVPRTPGGAPAAPAGPAVGTVRGNFRFKGGDPNSPAAWEPTGGAGSQGPVTFR